MARWAEAFEAALDVCNEVLTSNLPALIGGSCSDKDLRRIEITLEISNLLISAKLAGVDVDSRIEVLQNAPEATVEESFQKRMKRLEKLGDALDAALDVSITAMRQPFNFNDLPRSQVQASVALMVLSRVIPRLP